MSAEPFVDTNIWVYAHTAQTEDIRGPLARALVDDGRRFVISTQILSEYYSAMLKNRAADALIQDNSEAMILRCDVLIIDTATIRAAHKLKLRYRFSYCHREASDTRLGARQLRAETPAGPLRPVKRRRYREVARRAP